MEYCTPPRFLPHVCKMRVFDTLCVRLPEKLADTGWFLSASAMNLPYTYLIMNRRQQDWSEVKSSTVHLTMVSFESALKFEKA